MFRKSVEKNNITCLWSSPSGHGNKPSPPIINSFTVNSADISSLNHRACFHLPGQYFFPGPGDSGETFHQFLSRFSNRELDVAIRVHLLDQAGVLTPDDLRPLNRIFQKHGGNLQIEVTARIIGFEDNQN